MSTQVPLAFQVDARPKCVSDKPFESVPAVRRTLYVRINLERAATAYLLTPLSLCFLKTNCCQLFDLGYFQFWKKSSINRERPLYGDVSEWVQTVGSLEPE